MNNKDIMQIIQNALDYDDEFKYEMDNIQYIFKRRLYMHHYEVYTWKPNNFNFGIIAVPKTTVPELNDIKRHFVNKGFLFIFYSLTEHIFFITLSNIKDNILLTLDSDAVLQFIENSLRQSMNKFDTKIREESEEYFKEYKNYIFESVLSDSKDKSIDDIKADIHKRILCSLDYLKTLNKYIKK